MKVKTKSQNMKLFDEAKQLRIATREAMRRMVVNSLSCEKKNNGASSYTVCTAHNKAINSDS